MVALKIRMNELYQSSLISQAFHKFTCGGNAKKGGETKGERVD